MTNRPDLALISPLPPSLEKALGRGMGALRQLVELAIIALFLAMVAAVFLQVFTRYVLNASLPWTEELARFVQIWLVLLASGLAVQRGMHIAIDLFTSLLPHAGQVLLATLMHVLVIAYALVILRNAPDLLAATVHQTSPALGWSMLGPYLSVPVGMGYVLLEEIGAIYGILTGRRPVSPTPDLAGDGPDRNPPD